MVDVTQSQTWKALEQHKQQIESLAMRDLFAREPDRFQRLSLRQGDLLLDFSKNRVTDETLRLLRQLAREAGVEAMRDQMFSGETINFTENRAVLHVALRNRANRAILVDGSDVMPDVNAVLAAHARRSATPSAAGPGRATPASRSPTSSTSASAGRTSVR